ncbi:MAG: NAD(+) diphosphatase [Deltaproteobacteria bacterium]|nr:NAD(+) diphosphatase [Deltaproteobacteria bacterium]
MKDHSGKREERSPEPETHEREERADGANWFLFRGDRLLVERTTGTLPTTSDVALLKRSSSEKHYLGLFSGRSCYSADLDINVEPPERWVFQTLRQMWETWDEEVFNQAGLAFQIVNWHRIRRFCGHCGSRLEQNSESTGKTCPECGLSHFPPISPAIIVAVIRNQELLLARAHRHPSGMYSVIAGFVEPGETLEDCVKREVKEETGVNVKDIRYFGSQPWPFPHSLMIGFIAEYAGGEIAVDDDEIMDAGWFTADNLPKIPPKISIARKLIDWFVARSTGER